MPHRFDATRCGDLSLSNHIVMAPPTRNRASAGQVPNALMAQYYQQRAGAGLIISEATQVSAEGQGYLDTPGTYNAEQVTGWRRVADTVQAAGGQIVAQLWHAGRISHVSLQPGGQPPVSPTARRAIGKTFTTDGFVDVSTPHALCLDELPRIVADYRHAASLRRAGRFRRRRGAFGQRLPARTVPARQHQRRQRRVRRLHRPPRPSAAGGGAGGE